MEKARKAEESKITKDEAKANKFKKNNLANLWIDGIERGPAGSQRIRVTFSIDNTGMLSASAFNVTSEQE